MELPLLSYCTSRGKRTWWLKLLRAVVGPRPLGAKRKDVSRAKILGGCGCKARTFRCVPAHWAARRCLRPSH